MVRVDGAEAWFTRALFRDFCRLAAACLAGDAAGVEIDHSYVRRLRIAIDSAASRDAVGESLIRPVGKGKAGKTRYVLAKASDAIRVDPSFRAAPLTARLNEAIATQLLTRCTRQ